MQQLVAAEKALADFLEEGDYAGAADARQEVVIAETALQDLEFGFTVGEGARVRDAKVADYQESLAKKLSAAEREVAAVEGLGRAVNNFVAASEAQQKAYVAADKALVAQSAEEAKYETANDTSITISDDGTVADLIKTEGGRLVLESGVDEVSNPGVTELLSTVTARVNADKALVAANNTLTNAQAALDALDAEVDEASQLAIDAALVEVVTAFVTDIADDTAPTAAEIAAEQAHLGGLATLEAAIGTLEWESDAATTKAQLEILTAQAVEDGFLTDEQKTEINNAYVALDSDGHEASIGLAQAKLPAGQSELELLNAAVDLYLEANDNANIVNPISQNLIDAKQEISALESALSDLRDALVIEDELEALLQGIKDAQDYLIEELGVELPVFVDGPAFGTGGDDILVYAGKDGTIGGFGVLGEDALFIGSEYTFNADIKAGSDSALEVFFTQNGSNTVVSIETKAFGSNTTNMVDVDEIELTGVNADDLAFTDGYVVIA